MGGAWWGCSLLSGALGLTDVVRVRPAQKPAAARPVPHGAREFPELTSALPAGGPLPRRPCALWT